MGDHCWRMPLVDKYFGSLSSSFADFKNSSEGFGGAITAALFLQKFVNQKRWAHLDIYGWNDKSTGSLGFAGGSGQGVGLLIDFISKYKLKK
jgi:leucyl aminopeptidase